MPKLLPFENHARRCEKMNNFEEEEMKNFVPKSIINEAKQEYDFKEEEISEIEKITNSKLVCNIGYGGFSTVKLIFNHQQKSYFAMKVVC